MRKYRISEKKPLKPGFNTSFDLNEVPLPYYDPLEDPHLRNFFFNPETSKHIEEQGLTFSPRRRDKYAHFRRIIPHKFEKDPSQSCLGFSHQSQRGKRYSDARKFDDLDFDKTASQMFGEKRNSDSEVFRKVGRPPQIPQFNELILDRPRGRGGKKGNFSQEGVRTRPQNASFHQRRINNASDRR